MDTIRPVIRVTADGSSEAVMERMAEEAPWTLRLNGQELVTLILTPDDLTDLVYGYLANEGLIADAEDVSTLVIDEAESQVWVRVPALQVDPASLGRRLLTSCCGRGRPGLYFLNDSTIKPVDDPATLGASSVPALVDALDLAAHAFRETGGVHPPVLLGTVVSWRSGPTSDGTMRWTRFVAGCFETASPPTAVPLCFPGAFRRKSS
jgi:FdhD protein